MLGTGTSSGVPTIGCTCGTCRSMDPRDSRTRPSIWITDNDTSIIIDTSSDFRQQCLTHNITRLDGVVYTHHHFDHIAGFDDLRAFNYASGRPVPLFMTIETLHNIRQVFRYAFGQDEQNQSSIPLVDVTEIDDNPLSIANITFEPVPLAHGAMRVNGYRFGRAAYCTDCNAIPSTSFDLLHDLDVLILDALRLKPHPTHFTVDEAVAVAQRIGADRTYFTHIAHEILHETVQATLPFGIYLAYDGLTIDVQS